MKAQILCDRCRKPFEADDSLREAEVLGEVLCDSCKELEEYPTDDQFWK